VLPEEVTVRRIERDNGTISPVEAEVPKPITEYEQRWCS
jgi:hypothetical protein